MTTDSFTVRVKRITYEADGVNSYELVDAAGGELPPFAAGAHLDVHISERHIRQYSLCNTPGDRRRYVIAVLFEPNGRGGSRHMHQKLRVGDVLRISAPRNNFPLDNGAKRHLLIAGGIGITPIMAMVDEAREKGVPFSLHYCTRTREKTAFLERLADSSVESSVQLYHDEGMPQRGLSVETLLATPQVGTHVYCCGPAGLIEAVRAATRHWPAESVHFEYFAAPAATQSVEDAFSVEIGSTGAVLPVPTDKTILEVLRDHGVDVQSSCEAGVCGTCRTRYLEGEPDHRDYVLVESERREYVMVCVSRSKSSKLVLDL
jgi:ferredoxin-NADP reductase